jgi:hypothetical protein
MARCVAAMIAMMKRFALAIAQLIPGLKKLPVGLEH